MDNKIPFSGLIYNLYDNGQKEYEGEYKNGKPNGPLIYWHQNGNKMREGIIKNGIPYGKWNHYNEKGILQKTINHK